MLVRTSACAPRDGSPATSPAIEVDGVRVVLGGRSVLEAVSLVVERGEVTVLVGPNGAGKSTLLGVLAGDVGCVEGTVTIDGLPARRTSARALARRRAVLVQHPTVSFPFTVEQVVAMGRTPWRDAGAAADDEAIERALVDADVAHLRHRAVPTLSGGERARAALARVLAQETPILLLDEPTGALDVRHQEQVLAVVRRRAARGDAVVVVVHDLGVALAHADRAVLLRAGRVRAHGAPGAVLTPTVLSEVYEHPIEVISHPRTGLPIVLARRFEGDPG